MAFNFATDTHALMYGILIWLTGFIWGTFVFMNSSLTAIPSIPYVSVFPAISFPLLILLPILSWFLAKNYFMSKKVADEISLGATFFLVNFILDFLVLGLLFGNLNYFLSLTVWINYTLLAAAPKFANSK